MPSSDPSAVDVQKTTLQNTSSGGVPLTGSVRPPRPQSAIPAAAAHQRGAHNKDGGGPARARKPVRKVLPASTSSSESEESLIAAEEKGDKDAVWQLKQRMETAEEEAAAAAAAVIAEGDGSEFFANPNGPPLPPPPHRGLRAAQHGPDGGGGGPTVKLRTTAGTGPRRKMKNKSVQRIAHASDARRTERVRANTTVSAPESKHPASSKGKSRRLPRATSEKTGVELTDAIREVLNDKLMLLMREPEVPDDVFLSTGESRDFFIGVIAEAAPATLERAEELAETTALVRQKEARPLSKKVKRASAPTSSSKPRRTQNSLTFCGCARSSKISTLGRSI